MKDLAVSTDGWSGSDLESLTREAVMAPIRECLREAAIMKIRTRKEKQRISRSLNRNNTTTTTNNTNTNTNNSSRQSSSSSSSITATYELEEDIHEDENEVARDFLLARLENLRPVTLEDFENAATFWMGNGQSQQQNNFALDAVENNSNVCHYDTDSSSSSSDEDDSEFKDKR